MKKIRILALILVAVMALALIPGCADDSDKIKVGVIAPLTGDVAVYGNAVKNAVDLYVEQLNAAGGVNGRQIKLIVYDDKGDPTESLNAYNKLVSSDKIVALIGPVTSGPTFGVAQQSAIDNVPGITGTATHPDVTTYGNNYFRTCFEDPYQGGAITTFAFDYLKATTAAIIYNTSDNYSNGLKDSITAKAGELGLTITNTEGYGKDDADFNAQLTNIIANNPDVLFIPEYYAKAYMICSQARALGYTGTFLGVDGTDGILEIEGVDPSVVEGMYFVNHFAADDEAEMIQNFIKDYTEKYGQAPNAFAALGYDSAKIMCEALTAVDNAYNADVEANGEAATAPALGATPESYQAVIDELRLTNLECVTGRITFDENNNPIKDCTIIQIKNGKNVYTAKY